MESCEGLYSVISLQLTTDSLKPKDLELRLSFFGIGCLKFAHILYFLASIIYLELNSYTPLVKLVY